jgi:predicted glycogen debranching enzyme
VRVVYELCALHRSPVVLATWRVEGQLPANTALCVRPLVSGRAYHALHHENPAFAFAPRALEPDRVVFAPYAGVPSFELVSNARYSHAPEWYRNFRYAQETERGLDDVEDLASPGILRFDLSAGEARLFIATEGAAPALSDAESARERERERRRAFATPLHRAADAYLVQRGRGRSIIAGYPWFADWGRDTFISLRGLCLATGRLDVAGEILREWSGAVSDGMLPNRFPDAGETPEYNSVDASLWYVVCVGEYLARAPRVAPDQRKTLCEAVDAIIDGTLRGTRYRIHVGEDGLLATGERGVQLTWMDAKLGDWVVTPRIGKPVEVQALWLNALHIARAWRPELSDAFERGLASFRGRFWNEAAGYLYDVVDVDHQPGQCDAALRPNQLFAIGGLPLALLDGERARRVVDQVEAHLWTPLGPRSLAPGSRGYTARYQGGPRERDAAYHQGTVWPWLAGPFIEAWVRVRGGTKRAKREARVRLLAQLESSLGSAGLGHLPEIAEPEPPHFPRGCPFQAWSLGELLRLREELS